MSEQNIAEEETNPAEPKTIQTQLSELYKLSVPIVLTNLTYSMLNITDTIMAGMAGKSDLGGVAVGGSLFVPCMVFLQGMVAAVHPLIGRHRGGVQYHKIPHTHMVAFVACTIISVILMALLAFINWFVLDIDTDERMDFVAKHYIMYIIFTLPILTLFTVLKAYCEAMTYTKITFYFGLMALCYNIPLNYILIFGKFGLPEFGGVGCGIGTLLSIIISTAIFAFFISHNNKLGPYSLMSNDSTPAGSEIWRFLKLSLPLGFSASIESSCFSLVAVLLTPFGPAVVSGHSITMSIYNFLYTAPLSLGIALSIMVGYSIGAKDVDLLRTNIQTAYRSAFMSMGLTMLIIAIFNVKLVGIYTNDEEVMTIASLLMIILFLNMPFENLQTIQAFVLRGFKDTRFIFWTTLFAFWAVGLLIGMLLCYGVIHSPFEGAYGFWIGMLLSLIAATTCYRIRILIHWREIKTDFTKYF